jgi:hypothetical protein
VKVAVGISIVSVAVGAILTWGVGGAVAGFEVSWVGTILLMLGATGIAASVLYVPPLGSGDAERHGRSS